MKPEDDKLSVAIAGASGRMGHMVVQALLEADDMRITGALTAPDEPWVGRDLGVVMGKAPMGVILRDRPAEAFAGAHVVIDFSTPEAVRHFLPAVRGARAALVSGTTALAPEHFSSLETLAKALPILWAPNLSLGANLIRRLALEAARHLGPSFDLEILELHHRHKRDAPSGTALDMAQAVSKARGETQPKVTLRRHGIIGARGGADEVGIGVLRGGDVVGEHTIYFFGAGERIELAHKVTDRMAFARGAVRAARWLVRQKPALYTMDDLLEPV